ncbi:MAG: DNA polymerase III subunit alpha [Egibacteraceae bacterium]
MGGFAHLAATTAYSLRDGVIRPGELAEATAQRGMDAVGIADRGGLYGAVRVAQACAAIGVRPIIGADLALVHDPARAGWADRRARTGSAKGPGSGPEWLEGDPARVTLIARTQDGYAGLCRLVTDHHLASPRGEPHATWAQLERWVGRGGMVVLLADDSSVGRLLDAGRPDSAAVEAHRWMDLVGPASVLVGVTHHRAPADDARARARFALADRLGLAAVAHQAPRYLDPADARVADVMDAIRGQVPLDPRHTRRRNDQGYLKRPGEMHEVFAERPDALVNAAEVADRCRVDLGLGQLRVPDFTGAGAAQRSPAGGDLRAATLLGAELRARCEAGLAERYAAPGRRHRDLLDRELAMVARLGLAPYFLTVAEIVERIRDKQIMVACRGSAAGSLVCYCLRISDVDPIAHDLAFERFMNPYRDELPDIDLDVESARREDIYADLLARYGDDRVACVCMVETFKARMAIREVGKAIGLPSVEIDAIAKAFPRIRARDVRAALDTLPELAGLHLDPGEGGREAVAGGRGSNRDHLRLLFDLVERLDGLPRHVALHPSGVLLADRTLRDVVPLERSANGFAMAQFDKDDVEALGLCKLDVLAVRMLSSMAHCVQEVVRTRGVELDFEEVAWDDDPTYELIRSTRTLGMFQIESPGQRELIGKFQPDHFGDLVVDISLFRPGPVKGDMIAPFLQRRLGKAKVVYPHPLLERALGETYGVIVYHEQVMRCVAAVTGCDLSTADLVRRRLGDPDEAADLRDWVLAGCAERGIPEQTAVSLWDALAQFASFGFCKAHAAAFAVPTYRSAWLKRHYLPEFVAGLLTHDPGMYPRRLLLEDARQFGVCVLPLDVNRSAREYRVERVPSALALALLGVHGGPAGWRWMDGRLVPPGGLDLGVDPEDAGQRFGIRLGLQDVAGISGEMIQSLLAGRPFTDVCDLRRRAALSAPVAEALAHVGALDGLRGPGVTRRDLLLEVTERWSGVARHRPTSIGGPEQLGLLPDAGPAGLGEYTASEAVRAELEVLGLDASTPVIRFYDALLDLLGVTRAIDLPATRNRQRVRVAGVKVATQTPPVKSGQRVIFCSLDDATGIADAAFFESVHARCAATVFHSWLLVVEGTVRRAGARGVSVNAETAWDLRRLMRAWQAGTLDAALADPTSDRGPAVGDEPAPRRLWHASGGSAGG